MNNLSIMNNFKQNFEMKNNFENILKYVKMNKLKLKSYLTKTNQSSDAGMINH